MIKDAVFLAAGIGSRLQNDSIYKSKPMLSIFGKSLISFGLDLINQISSIKNIHIIHNGLDNEIFKIDQMTDKNVNFILDANVSGSFSSFLLCRFLNKSPFLLLDCDLVFSHFEFMSYNVDKINDDKSYMLGIINPKQNQIPTGKVEDNRITEYSKNGFYEGIHCGYIYKFSEFPSKATLLFQKSGNRKFSEFLSFLVSNFEIGIMYIPSLIDIDCISDLKLYKKYIKNIIKRGSK